MKGLAYIIVLLIAFQTSIGQVIDENRALQIAEKEGLNNGLGNLKAKLTNDTIWEVKNLICEDEGKRYRIIQINAKTCKIIKREDMMTMHIGIGDRKKDKTVLDYAEHLDSLPLKAPHNKPYRLTQFDKGNEGNPNWSDNDKWIAFQYENNKIGIISLHGENFRKICDECSHMNWLKGNWLSYYDHKSNRLVKKNVHTGNLISMTNSSSSYKQHTISGDSDWIAYTSGEIWSKHQYDSSGKRILYSFSRGNGLELCLISKKTNEKKYVTKTGKYVHSPCWSKTGDTLFFYIETEKYFATDFDHDEVSYSKLKELKNISLRDYKKIKNGMFPKKINCKIFMVNAKTLTPIYKLINDRGRYGALAFSYALDYLVFSKKDCKKCDNKLWVLPLE